MLISHLGVASVLFHFFTQLLIRLCHIFPWLLSLSSCNALLVYFTINIVYYTTLLIQNHDHCYFLSNVLYLVLKVFKKKKKVFHNFVNCLIFCPFTTLWRQNNSLSLNSFHPILTSLSFYAGYWVLWFEFPLHNSCRNLIVRQQEGSHQMQPLDLEYLKLQSCKPNELLLFLNDLPRMWYSVLMAQKGLRC